MSVLGDATAPATSGHIETFERLNCAPDICHSNSLHQLKRAQ